jgi:hypothetical protein
MACSEPHAICSDPAVSVIVDIQNTLINKIFYTYASAELQSKFAPNPIIA